MIRNQKFSLSKALLLSLPLICATSTYAASPIDLKHQDISMLKTFVSPTALATQNGVRVEEVSRSAGLNQTLHIRTQQTYLGYPVRGGDAIVHIPHEGKTTKSLAQLLNMKKVDDVSMNGFIYQDLQADLAKTSKIVFTPAQAYKAVQFMMNAYQDKIGIKADITHPLSKLIVYLDETNTAHWAYKVTFDVAPIQEGKQPAKPVYLIDAVSFHVYAEWDNIQTLETFSLDAALGGGNGGNLKMGKKSFDGLGKHLPKLNIQYFSTQKTCYWRNDDVVVEDYNTGSTIAFNKCRFDKGHDNIYWIATQDQVNDGYGPASDALFGGAVINDMYQKWYNVPVLTNADGSPMVLTMVVHIRNYDNAYWDGQKMSFGDGASYFYPLTSLGVAAHEISHGFTEQHSGLEYYGQSGGMNEAYSDMAAQAAEFYAYNKNSWQIGPEIFKAPDEALRYMDKPSKDCHGGTPGDWCSIDDASQYTSGLDVHFSSGVYNHLFYLMGKSKGWDTKKAFDVMVDANQHYWTNTSTFIEGACGILKSAKDYGYEVQSIKKALKKVKIDITAC